MFGFVQIAIMKYAPGSIQELQNLTTTPIANDIELHKPYIDEVQCTCPKCNGVMQRTPEVIDVWFDSGSMPFAQYHYPFGDRRVLNHNFRQIWLLKESIKREDFS